jgi:hypothetical protein
MKGLFAFCSAVASTVATAFPLFGQGLPVSGFVGAEVLQFTQGGAGPETINRLSAELRTNGKLSDALSFDLRLFYSRAIGEDGGDYVDPRVAKISWEGGNWQAVLGYDIVYWGVAESQNVVNIVNQRDQVRDLQGDLALGQAMFALRYFGPSWALEGFVLPKFRNLDYGVDNQRWGFGFPVDGDSATFESADGEDHVDFALRFSGAAGDLEYGISVFDGTLRRPELRLDAVNNTLIPHYILARQYGIDLQFTRGATLFKFEGIHVDPRSAGSYNAAVYGIEHNLGTVGSSGWEATLFAEHNWDSRGNARGVVFQNDLFLGARINFANVRDSQLTLGAMYDLDHGGLLGNIEFDTRLTDQLSLNAQYTFVSADDPDDALFTAQDIDQLTVRVEWNF